MHAYLACFDISDNKTRYRAARCLSAYGVRVQRSVYEISIETPNELEEIKQRLIELLDPEDDMRFYAICLSCRKKSHKHDNERIAIYPRVVII